MWLCLIMRTATGISRTSLVSEPPLQADSCGAATDLSTVSTPYLGTTKTGMNTHATSCGGSGNEQILYIDVPPDFTLNIGMSSNSYDSTHETRWGGACPGNNLVKCTDDPDTEEHVWNNDQGAVQRAYFIIDAYSTGSGDFTLNWTVQAPTPASATGDPHLQNIFGERFDLMQPGKVVLLDIPRGMRVETRLLVVEADVQRLGGHCADMYFQTLNITGAWADKVRTGGFSFSAQGVRDETDQMHGWMEFGPLNLKVVHGHTSQGIKYLNFYVKHLGHAGVAVGGLLGEDDHTQAATPSEECLGSVSLQSTSNHKDESASAAMASLA